MKNLEYNTLNLIDSAPIAILTFNKNGEIDYVNKSFGNLELLYGFEYPDNLLGSSIFGKEIFPKFALTNELNEVLSGLPFEKELDFVETKTSGLIHLIIKGSPVYENEEVIGGILIIEDLKILSRSKKESAIRNDFIDNAIHNVADFFIVVDRFDRIQFFSKNILHYINVPINLIQNASIGSLFDSDTSRTVKEYLEHSKKNRVAVNEKMAYEVRNNKKVFDCRFVPQENYKKEISFVYLFFKDITAQEREIDNLYHDVSKIEFYKTISTRSNEAVFVTNADHKIVYWDDNAEKLYEVTKEEALGAKANNAVSILSENFLDSVRLKLNEKEYHKIVLSYFDKNREKKTYEAYFTYLNEKNDRIIIKSVDISDKILFEDGLKQSLKGLRDLLSKSPSMIVNIDHDGQILYANPAFQKRLDYSEEELLSSSFYNLVDANYIDNNIFDFKSFIGDEPKQIDLPLKNKKGKITLFKGVFHPSKDKETTLRNFSCFFNEYEEHSFGTEESKLFHSLVENAYDGIALTSDGRVLIANQSFANIFGYGKSSELINKEIVELSSNDDIIKVAEYFRLLERKKEIPTRFDFLGKKKDGSNIHTELSIGSFESNGKNYFVMIARDVTERIRTQRAIRESEEKYRNITENIDDFLFTFERIGLALRPIFCTSSIQKVTGYTQAEFLTDSKMFLKAIHPSDFAQMKPKLINLLKSRIQLSGEFEFRIINKQGNIVWVRAKINIVRTGTGRIQKIFGLVSDVTFRKRAEEELKKSTQNLIKLNETKDRFISIISHDLRTPFSSILGFTDLLANDEELTDDERKQYVKYIQESSRSMLALVNSLLDWTRLQTGRIKFEPQKIDVSKIVIDSVNALSGTAIQKGIEVTSFVNQSLHLFVDKSLILQVFNNLISNAIKFTNKGGSINILSEAVTSSRFVKFIVKDTGVGIKDDDLAKLFSVDAKYTSEGTAGEKGSGLGLSLVKEIIEKHGGAIEVESEYGKGTEFIFTLPIASSNILIVDDNKTDRLLYSKILKNITPEYNVEVASDGREAIQKILSSPPALVITDHAMPIMNGYEFVVELKKMDLKGKPPIIVLSSDIDRAVINDYTELGIEFVFHKPVNIGSFKLAIEKSLQKGLSGD
ncbi:MAG: PAS domain S-box protein [Ignavibacteriales bacterium]|nr:PAS domain S-box protein [Ignavibacteriales bacterium]